MITRREAALRLDIPLEMAQRHEIPTRQSEAEFERFLADPPAWLVQSRANRTGKRPVWVQLTCDICGFTEAARPKKWWPTFTYLSCEEHGADELPALAAGHTRGEFDGIGSRFIGIVDHNTAEPTTDASTTDASTTDASTTDASTADAAAAGDAAGIVGDDANGRTETL
jgi:hypothetical protein